MQYKKEIAYVRKARAEGQSKAEILNALEAYYRLTDKQAHEIYEAAVWIASR